MNQGNQKSKVISIALLTIWCFLLFTGCSQAISPAELQKIESAAPAKATAAPAQPRKLLVFNLCNGYVHSSIPYGAKAIEIMGQKTGAFEVVQSKDMSIFKPENLSQFDAVCFNNTTRLDFKDPALRRSLIDFIKGGKGIVGIHAATDNFYNWPQAAEMMGGQFTAHPWGAGGTWAVKIDDPEHPLTAAFGGEGFKTKEEIYRTKPPLYSRSRQRVLMSLDMTDKATRGAIGVKPSDMDTGISWVKSYGKGRLFYCSLGHNHHIFWNPKILRHYLDGIQFALGDLSVDTTPSGLDTKALEKLLAAIATYQYGQSREPLTQLTDIVRSVHDYPKDMRKIEKRVLRFLRSDATLASKQFVCRKLSIIGTEEAVPALSAMLTETQTSDMARYALERIPGAAVDKALHDALDKTSGKVKIGIINSLGQRSSTAATKALGKLLSDTDKEIARAAAAALGKIGGKKPAETLKKALRGASGDLRMVLADACLMCADKFLAEGNTKSASAIYKQLYAGSQPESIRIAALRGKVTTAGKKAADIVVDVLKKGEPAMQTAAAALVREVPGTKIVEAAAAELPNLPADCQVQLLSALADRDEPAALPAVVKATKSTEDAVRIAALNALGVLGDASSVDLLAGAAAAAAGAEQQAARESLYRLRGPEIDETILKNISEADPKVKAELIRSLGQRYVHTAAEALLETAKDSDSKVRLESFKTLRTVAYPKDLPALVELLINIQSEAERSEAERTVAAVANKIDDKNRRAEAVLAVLDSVKRARSRCSLLSVLGKIADNSALPVLRTALNDKDAKITEAAIRALSEWPTAEPMADLLKVARASDNEIQQVLALRGFIRIIGLDSDRPADETVELYTQAMNLASNVNEKKMVLSGLANVKSFAALYTASNYLNDSALLQEAGAAMVKIAEATADSHPQQTRILMRMVIETSKSEPLRQQVQKIIEQIE